MAGKRKPLEIPCKCKRGQKIGESGDGDGDADVAAATVTLQAGEAQQPPGGGDPRGNERAGQDVSHGETSNQPPSRSNRTSSKCPAGGAAFICLD